MNGGPRFRNAPSVLVPDLPLQAARAARLKSAGLYGPGGVLPSAVNINAPPPENARPLDFSMENNRGSGVVISPFDPTGALLIGSFEAVVAETPKDLDRVPERMSIVLGLEADGNDADNQYVEPVNVKANLLWGMGGVTFKAQCDWNNGSIITLPASYVRVSGVYTTVTPGLGNPPKLRLYAGFAYGDMPHYPVTLTQAFSIATGVTTAAQRIPKFARSLGICSRGNATPSLTIAFFSDSGLLRVLGTYNYTDNTNAALHDPDTYLIPNGATFYTITNNAANTETVQAVFGLSF